MNNIHAQYSNANSKHLATIKSKTKKPKSITLKNSRNNQHKQHLTPVTTQEIQKQKPEQEPEQKPEQEPEQEPEQKPEQKPEPEPEPEPIKTKTNESLFQEIGILDPLGKNLNPLTNKPYENLYFDKEKKTYANYAEIWTNFPMYEDTLKKQIIQTIHDKQVVLIVSGTGSGKTVLTPKYALHALNYQGKIAITNPKKIPAESAAEYAAKTLDVTLGSHIGIKHKTSNPKHFSKESKLVYCTDGHILMKFKSDPMLSDYDGIIIDEAHERGLNIDLLLLQAKELVLKRPNFKLIIMSATINETIFVNYFKHPNISFEMINALGKPHYPIEEIFYHTSFFQVNENNEITNSSDEYLKKLAELTVKVLKETHESFGDILVFVGGIGQCNEGCQLVKDLLNKDDLASDMKVYCNALTSKTPKDIQTLLIKPDLYKNLPEKYNRKVVFATNVAESSITVDGIDIVIDSGLVHVNLYYPDKNMESMEKQFISKASHKQRKGRTGRIRPGRCYNLFTENDYQRHFKEYALSNIYMSDISQYVLWFMALENVSHVDLPFSYQNIDKHAQIDINSVVSLQTYLLKLIEPPYETSVNEAIKQLYLCDAITYNEQKTRASINEKGIAMSKFPLTPNLSSMLIESYNYHCKNDMLSIVSLLSLSEMKLDKYIMALSDIYFKKENKHIEKHVLDKQYHSTLKKFAHKYGDVISLLQIYNQYYKIRYPNKPHLAGNAMDTDTDADADIESSPENDEISFNSPIVDIDHDQKDATDPNINTDKKNAKKWCEERYLKFRAFESVAQVKRELKMKLQGIINSQKENGNFPSQLFVRQELPRFSSNEENVLMALTVSNLINFVKLPNHGSSKTFQTCANSTSVTATISDNRKEFATFFDIANLKAKHGICLTLKNIFGNKKLLCFNVIPSSVMKYVKDIDKYKDIITCKLPKKSAPKHRTAKQQKHKYGQKNPLRETKRRKYTKRRDRSQRRRKHNRKYTAKYQKNRKKNRARSAKFDWMTQF